MSGVGWLLLLVAGLGVWMGWMQWKLWGLADRARDDRSAVLSLMLVMVRVTEALNKALEKRVG